MFFLGGFGFWHAPLDFSSFSAGIPMALFAQKIALVESGVLPRLEPCRVDLAFATGLFAPRW